MLAQHCGGWTVQGSDVVCVCLAGGQVSIQSQQPGVDACLLLAVQCCPHIILILPQHIVLSIQGGRHGNTVHLCAVNDSRVRGWLVALSTDAILFWAALSIARSYLWSQPACRCTAIAACTASVEAPADHCPTSPTSCTAYSLFSLPWPLCHDHIVSALHH